ncbi:hypothetical protein ACFV2B_02760 [Streptomyces lavendulae]|uniref:hypothetical protein n=1 Tax=Streptomyces lavendulae TaxID=1914 RepID=UPI0036D0B38A
MRELRRHLLGGVQHDQQRPPGGRGQPGHPLGRPRRHGPRPARGDDPAGRFEGPGHGVGQGGVPGPQVGPAQPQRRRGEGAARAVGGEGGEGGGAAGAGGADQAQDRALAGGEGGQPGGDRGARHGLRRGVGHGAEGLGAGRAEGGRGELQHPGEVEVGPVPRHGGGVAFQQGREGAAGRRRGAGAQRDGEVPGAVLRAESGAEDREHRSGLRVEDRPPAGLRAPPEGVPAVRADRQLDGGGQEMGAAGRGVGDLRTGREHPRLAPAPRGEAYVRPRRDLLAGRDRQRPQPQPVGPYEGQPEVRQGGHVLRAGGPAPVARTVQHHPARSVDGRVAGDHRAAVVGHEAAAARPPGLVADQHEPHRTARGVTRGGIRGGTRRVTGPRPRPGPAPGETPGRVRARAEVRPGLGPATPRTAGDLVRHRRTTPLPRDPWSRR